MPASDDLTNLQKRVQELEGRLGFPQKLELSRNARASAEARKSALQLPDNQKSQELASAISALADANNVVVEWSAREVPGMNLAAVRCCCCCCCCVIVLSW